MDLEQRLRESLVAPDPGAVFTARVMARVRRGRGRRTGVILISTVLVVGAAAAMLVWRMFDVRPAPVEVVALPVADAEPVVEGPVQAIPQGSEPVAAVPPKPEPPKNTSPRFSVLVMPLRQEAQSVAGRGAVEALYAAVLDELRKVPGLSLQVMGESESDGSARPVYVLTITSLATTVSQSGGAVMRATDGNTRCTENGGPEMFCGPDSPLALDRRLLGVRVDMDYSADGAISTFTNAGLASPESVVWVEMKVEAVQSATALYTLPMRAEGTPDLQRCKSSVGVLPSDCMTPAQLAVRQVETLRLQAFPPDATFQQRVLARLGNASADPAGGMVLQELLQGLVRGDGSRLDAGTIQALVRYMAGQPANTRASIWSALSRVSHPALVAPLVESLRHDVDRQVRLLALANLAANYSTDPVVRSTFEEIDRDDSDAIVRATARRALYGQALWRDDVLAALDDSEVSYEARLAPLIANTTAGSPQQEMEMYRVRQSVLREQQVFLPLMTLIREHLRDSDHAQATGSALGLLASVDDPPVFDLFLQLMQEKSLPLPISSEVGNWAINHQNDPRVREILPQTEAIVPSNLLERLRQITEKTGGAGPGEGSATYGSGAGPIVIFTPPAQ